MKITFYSNYLNHLQTSFCEEMYRHLGNDFRFVSTQKLPLDRLSSGYQDCSHYPYNINSFESEEYFNEAIELGINSDIVVIGSAPEIFIKERLLKNKHTFRYSERILKQKWRLFDPRLLWKLFFRHTQYRNKNVYILCASAFTTNDLDLIFAYPNKRYKWGYFTEVNELEINQVISQKSKDRIEIIWVGRFLDWKHPELAVKMAQELKNKGYDINLSMIGAGEQVAYIRTLIEKLNVSDCVSFLGNLSNAEVRNLMQKSNIFIFTSDRNEGWGAVLNEAMSNGCAIVASNEIGSVPYLIENKKNGLIFKSNNIDSLINKVEILLLDKVLCEQLARNSYQSMIEIWNPKLAASNFLILTQSILDNKTISFEKGPCSIAERTKKNFWNN
nr:glycosyltransferase [uncultured Flavobacterium sp.]